MILKERRPVLNAGFQIYLYTAIYDRTILIIGGGYGLTNHSSNFCVARNDEEAVEVVTSALNAELKGEALVKRVSVSLASKQDPAVYMSPQTHPGHQQGYTL